MKKILIIDDEEDILDLLEFNLNEYEVFTMQDSPNDLEKFINKNGIDLLIMDRNLPTKEGSIIVKTLRQKGITIPVIYLTAKDKETDILEGFERGADDYITKPFNILELKARINAILKRVQKSNILEYKDIKYDDITKTITINNKPIDLTKTEKKLLITFLKSPNKIFSREELLYEVWENSFDTQLKTVNVAIKRLKEKIDPDKTKNYIKSIRGEGYMLC